MSAQTSYYETLFSIIAFLVVLFGCEEENLREPLQEITEEAYIIGQEITEEAFIIGVDPCSFPVGHSGKIGPKDGFVLRLVESNDTVVTYNLPEGIVKAVEFESSKKNYLFRKEIRNSLKLIFTYRQTPTEEKYYPFCLANIYTGDFSRAVEDRQVIVINAEKGR